MTWGAYWLFYKCPKCGKKFKHALETMTESYFGKCPVCGEDGILVSETKDRPKDADEYEDAYKG